jgi:hypothetical protein
MLVMQRDATLSKCGKYRYRLTRRWGDGAVATFIMLNPSTADALVDDATIRKCMGFARRWGMSGLMVGNLFAYRATNPRDMRRAPDPVGPDNERHLHEMCHEAGASGNGGLVVCAWGANGSYMQQDQTFLGWCEGLWIIRPKALRLTSKGMPEHPLYVPYDTGLVEM